MQTPQLIHEGYLQKRMLFGWRKHYCVLRGRNMELYGVISTTNTPKQTPRRVLVVEQYTVDFRTSDQFEVVVAPRGSRKTFRFDPDQIKRGEKNQWIQALQTALLCDNALEKYGADITKQLLTYATKQVSEHGSLRLDDSMWKTLRKRSIHGDLWSRFQELVAKGVEVTEVLPPPAVGLAYLLRIDQPPVAICLLPLEPNADERVIELKHVLVASDCLQCDATDRMTRFSLTYMVPDHGQTTEIFQTNSTDMRSRLVFGLSHILKQLNARRLSAPPPMLIRERTSDASSRSLSSIDGNQMDSAIRSFNVNPTKGIAHAVEQGVIEANEPTAVADFLRGTKGLDKDRIGDYLGGGDVFCLQVLAAFAQSFHFGGKPFEVCLREFLTKFRMPGEGQKIDRMMEAFAHAFQEKNPTVFDNQDAVHSLAFATIMLNTDLHNQSKTGRKRMTKAEFLHMARGINNGASQIPPTILDAIFDSIKKQALVTVRDRDDNGNLFANPDMSGWLRTYRRSGIPTPWRYFMLCSNCLYFFESQTGIDPLGFYALENVVVQATPNRPRRFELRAATSAVKSALYPKRAARSGNLAMRAQDRVVFGAESAEDIKTWVAMLEKHVLRNEHAAQLLKRGLVPPRPAATATVKRGSTSTSYDDVDEI
ncbi:Aste57867_20708 [Aphanomyces stellatus]|uniref:Aste57867_20708 protein n=1 Tax=Aphanomyces stellatus TaxID=120398 RepID=A0A485LFR7_9STRA|nr:hypothetical protein As57867_020640 [Aphanomyces stellatus]VFT97388.1 Aste57867_20708 [Aphanomyces stellatus]